MKLCTASLRGRAYFLAKAVAGSGREVGGGEIRRHKKASPAHLMPLRGAQMFVLAACLLFAALLSVTPLSAHGGGKQQLAGETAGPYRLYVWSSPDPWRVGEAHTTVAVTRLLPSGEETPATGLQVFVTYNQGEQSQRIAAVEQAGAQAGYYEADNAVAAAGDWRVTVEVNGTEGQGRAGFVETVLPANQFNWWLIGGGVLLALLLLGFFGTRKAGLAPNQRAAGKTSPAQRGAKL